MQSTSKHIAHFFGLLTSVCFFVSFSLSLFAETSTKNQEALPVSIEVISVEYPPFTSLLMPSGGIAFELLKNISTNNPTWEPIILPPARAGAMIQKGDWCVSFYPATKQGTYATLRLSETEVRLGLVRKKQTLPFEWTRLDELSGTTVAMLRTSQQSNYYQQYRDAGINVIPVETVESAIQMVLLDRVDYAFADDVSFFSLEKANKQKLQFSDSTLQSLPVTAYVNLSCTTQLQEFLPLDALQYPNG